MPDLPVRIMTAELPQVGDITNVVADAVGFHIAPIHRASQTIFQQTEAFEDRRTVFASTTQVVDLARPWVGSERFKGSNDIGAMDLIADLLSLVAKDGIRF